MPPLWDFTLAAPGGPFTGQTVSSNRQWRRARDCAVTTLRGAPGMFNMKHLVQIACTAALISASSYSYAAQNGINYDPAHSKAYNDAQHDYNGPNGVAGMTAAI